VTRHSLLFTSLIRTFQVVKIANYKEVNYIFFTVLSSTKLACLSLKKEADVDSGVIPEAFPEQEPVSVSLKMADFYTKL
jgi:hypothetical protein